MNIRSKLNGLGLTGDNAVVVGSGILNALGIRDSNDIDVVVSEETYSRLDQGDRYTKKEKHGCVMLTDGLFEIGTSWRVLGKKQTISDLYENSVVIDGIRYISLEFLYAVKRSWLPDNNVRPKDVADVKLMEVYLEEQQ